MTKRTLIAMVAYVIVGMCADAAHAQMFGQRNLGGTLQSRPSPASSSLNPGSTIRGRRFVRGSRRNNFVGSDRQDTRQFVGRSEAGDSPRVQSAASGVRTATTNGSNPPLQQPAAGSMYLPKIVLGEGTRLHSADVRAIEQRSAVDLANRLTDLFGSPIEVSVANRTATIRGAVASAADRRRAEILASFEPAVSAVANELQLVGEKETRSSVPPEPMPVPIDRD